MKKLSILFFILFECFISSPNAFGQLKRIAVIGSSTSYGYFNGLYPRDSGYVAKLNKYYKNEGLLDTIYNLAVNGMDCYNGMPTGYQPPPGRPAPDPDHNITMAVSKSPKPNVVIVNYPSNNYSTYTPHEVMLCLQTIRDYALSQGVECYITTSQPRTQFNLGERKNLKDIADSTLLRFGNFAIDFFYEIVDLSKNLIIKEEYALGDGVHLNPAGHTVLENKVIQKNILLSPTPIRFADFHAEILDNKVSLTWKYETDSRNNIQFYIERNVAGTGFQKIGQVVATTNQIQQYVDSDIKPGSYFYRIKGIEKTGQGFYSDVIAVRVRGEDLQKTEVTVTSGEMLLSLKAVSIPFQYRLISSNGATVLKGVIPAGSASFRLNVSSLPKGIYTIELQNKEDRWVKKVLKP